MEEKMTGDEAEKPLRKEVGRRSMNAAMMGRGTASVRTEGKWAEASTERENGMAT